MTRSARASSRGRRGAVVGLAAWLGCTVTQTDPITPEPTTRPTVAPVERPSHERARERVRSLDGDAALSDFARLLAADPGDAAAGLGLAQTAIEFGLEDRARERLERVIAADQTHAFGGRLGLALLEFARFEAEASADALARGEGQLRNLLAVDPQNDHALALAVALYLAAAERELERYAVLARTICQEHEPVHATLAASCAEEAWRRGDPARARALFAQATRTDPEHHGAWLRWAILEFEAGGLRSARRYLERAAQSPWPSVRISAQLALGVTRERLGDTPGAVAAYDGARELCEQTRRPVPPELLYNLGLAASRTAADEEEIAAAEALLAEYLASGRASEARKLRVQQALAELASVRAEQQRAH